MSASHRLEFAPPAPPGLLRAFGLAIVAHSFLLLALTLGVRWKHEPPVTTFEAEIWASVPEQAAPRAAEVVPAEVQPAPPAQAVVPTPAPPIEPTPDLPVTQPARPPLVDPAIAIAQEKQRQKAAQQRQETLARDRVAQEKVAKIKLEQDRLARERAAKDKQAEAQRLAELEARKKQSQLNQKAQDDARRAEAKRSEAQRLENLQRMANLAGGATAAGNGSANATGQAARSAGPSASYAGKIQARIKPNIIFTEEAAGNPVAVVEVRMAPDGTITGRTLKTASGVKAWDDAVLKAIDKTETLPRDTDGRVPPSLLIGFRPRD